ncbi:uncharacterized protein LOC113380703 [Ctenocephalides felis]|uniref:uncharacterized protein LOC113380703 n=1 Tax=Ctenocephalides felis TaxID=7515 RepID=UPI000E6E4608|nr:uncharacterized protein LOC113380703 [Ctenocephalides felis]
MADFKVVSTEPNVKKLQYADDIYLYVSCPTMDRCISSMSNAIEESRRWLLDNNLNLSQDKFSAAIFTRHRKEHTRRQIRIGCQEIQIKENIKVLGINLDKKMNFKKHVDDILSKCEKGLNVLRKITSMKWGAHPETCLNIYRSLIRSQIDCGGTLYMEHSQRISKKVGQDSILGDKNMFGGISINSNECINS